MSNTPSPTRGSGGGGGGGGSAQSNVAIYLGRDDPRSSMGENDSDKKEVAENQLRESIHKWLSPPEQYTNHHIARSSRHKGTTDWFLQGSIYREWKEEASLLWIHGIPGSGKTVLCSTIIEDIAAMCEAGHASMAYFYFDFRNVNKQHLHDLIPSILIQLSARSQPRHDILSRLYDDHDNGTTRPSDLDLVYCLKQILFSLSARYPIYLVMDALDECPDSSGIPSPRDRVLQLVKELVELRHPNLRICVTSRLESDIRDVLEPLTSLRVSLHDQSGQKQNIDDYVKSVVYSDSIMKRWKTEDKEHVTEALSERADGMFRLVSSQLKVLRHCAPSNLRRSLKELPESIDKTYERILREIKEPNRNHALRIFQCLVVAGRPLRVGELAGVLAVDFDDPEGIPKLEPSWRRDDEEQALLSSCSSLITIVSSDDPRVVQFSHPSVKEFLTSPRLATSSGDVSRYHIALNAAHTIMGQACLAVLLHSDDPREKGIRKTSSLAGYASQHWAAHAQFENVASYLRKPMEYLFDSDKPYFAAWLELIHATPYPRSSTLRKLCLFDFWYGGPLYCAALCGFYDLAEYLIGKYPQQVNARGGRYSKPILAALTNEHFKVAELLIRHGAAVEVPSDRDCIPLNWVAYYGPDDAVRFLLKHNADVNSQNDTGCTPLNLMVFGYTQNTADMARLLLEHGADPNIPDHEGCTPLHQAASYGKVEVACVLLEHGAKVNKKNNWRKTPLQVAVIKERNEIIELLSEHGAKSW